MCVGGGGGGIDCVDKSSESLYLLPLDKLLGTVSECF